MTDSLYSLAQTTVDLLNYSAGAIGLQKKIGEVKAVDKSIVGMASVPGRHFVRLAGLSGAIAVSMAAYGEHGLKPSDPDTEKLKKVFDVGNKMHLIHSIALMACPLTSRPVLTGTLMTAGIMLFCGSCYAHALTGNRSIRYITPYGGMTLILAWIVMIF